MIQRQKARVRPLQFVSGHVGNQRMTQEETRDGMEAARLWEVIAFQK